MYYHRHKSNSNSRHRFFPWPFIVIGISVLTGNPISWIIMLLIGIGVLQYLTKKNQTQAYVPSQEPGYIQSYDVPVTYVESTASKPVAKNYCFECGGKVENNARYCRLCGTDQRV